MGSGQRNQRHLGFTHGVGWCAPQQGACKLTLNVKDGIIEEALVETLGCSGMTHSAAMAAEILLGQDDSGGAEYRPGLRRDQHSDAGAVPADRLWPHARPLSPKDGLAVGACLGGPGQGPAQPGRHHVWHTKAKGPRYLEMAEGYVTRIALDEDDEVIGYEFVNLGKMMDFIKKGVDRQRRHWRRRKPAHYGQL